MFIVFLILTYPLRFLPYSWIHRLGRCLGTAVYFCYPRYRKRALSNLALASSLHLEEKEIMRLAKESIQSVAITFLEYPKLAHEKEISKVALCENPDAALQLINQGQGIIFFCGHQANWELLFLEGTSRMPGVAIGRPIKNKHLYRWVVKIREKFGGTIIPPKNALKEGLKALKSGKFLGIVGDQGMPDSGFSSSFLGRMAWTSPLPALLSIRTGCPIIVATIRREDGFYKIHYSDPIWPESQTSAELMEKVLALFEASVKRRPHEWLWIHNRWKTQLPGRLPKMLRSESLGVVLSLKTLDVASKLRTLYPIEHITLFIPKEAAYPFSGFEVVLYETIDDILVRDFRLKLILDFTQNPRIRSHFKKLAASNILSFQSQEEFFSYAL